MQRTITNRYIPFANRNRPGTPMRPTYITVHNTANTDTGADAEMHARYLNSGAGGRAVSWHFTADDRQIIQHLPEDEIGWHAGDGSGPGNSKSIGIEICENEDGDYGQAEENAVWLIRKLMQDHDISIAHVVPHQKWTGKHCPGRILNRWDEFISRTEEGEYQMKKVDAEKLIQLLQANFKLIEDTTAETPGEKEIHRLANEIRKAARMEVE